MVFGSRTKSHLHLKYVSKLWGHFVRSFDNFVIFHSIAVFSSKMQSMGNEGIFQKNFFELIIIDVGKKERSKFSVFRRTSLYGIIFISAYPPLLDEAKNITLILIA